MCVSIYHGLNWMVYVHKSYSKYFMEISNFISIKRIFWCVVYFIILWGFSNTNNE